jgi:hypothetical protein
MDLSPILVSGFGRSGTTALMALLGSDPRVVLDGAPPYECRHLTYLAKFAALLGRRAFRDGWTGEQMCDFDHGGFGSPSWWPPAGPSRIAPPAADWLRQLWRLAGDRARWQRPAIEYYAEKVPPWVPAFLRSAWPGLPQRTVHLARDPRDLYLSANAFMRSRGYHSFARAPGDGDADHARNLAHALLEWFENYRADRGRADAVLVRYEELALDRPGLAGRLGRWLGLSLDPAAGEALRESHGTAGGAEASVGRWRREGLAADVRRTLEAPLAEAMAELGYGDVEPAPTAEPVRFAELLTTGPRPGQSDHGALTVEGDGTVSVSVTGDDFWVALPPTALPAETVREVWLCLTGGVGDHCSIYWHRSGEGFAERRRLHVPFHPGPHWRVLRFRVGDHPLWRGTITGLRLDPFNVQGPAEPGRGRLRWLRFVA